MTPDRPNRSGLPRRGWRGRNRSGVRGRGLGRFGGRRSGLRGARLRLRSLRTPIPRWFLAAERERQRHCSGQQRDDDESREHRGAPRQLQRTQPLGQRAPVPRRLPGYAPTFRSRRGWLGRHKRVAARPAERIVGRSLRAACTAPGPPLTRGRGAGHPRGVADHDCCAGAGSLTIGTGVVSSCVVGDRLTYVF